MLYKAAANFWHHERVSCAVYLAQSLLRLLDALSVLLDNEPFPDLRFGIHWQFSGDRSSA